jgi:hypothetical protein
MSNQTQQTVVDKIVALLNKEGFAPVLTEEEIKSFKEMEKEQMIDFAFNALKIADDTMNGYVDVDKLYNETYGGNK